jgi:chemotaxis protein CheD
VKVVAVASEPVDVFVRPGEYFVGDASYRIHTLLGSCVSIVLWHPKRKIGALSHFLLSKRGSNKPTELDARYGEDVVTLMETDLKQYRVPIQECQGKIFGGGNMFPQQVRPGALNVGKQNGETARNAMRQHGISVVSESLFGVGHRRIIFDVASGHVWVHQVEPVETQTKARRASS